MRLLTGKPAELRSSMMADMGLYRYRVFVEKLGWELQCEAGLEYDQFDRDDTVYVVAQDDDGDIIAATKILSQLSGPAGGIGTYQISASQTLSLREMRTAVASLTSVQVQIDQTPTLSAQNISVTLA